MTETPKSPAAQAILDEMKPLGEWLMKARPLTRALGRTEYVNRRVKMYTDIGRSEEAAKESAYDDLREIDKEWDVKNKRYNQLATKYRKQRMADDKVRPV